MTCLICDYTVDNIVDEYFIAVDHQSDIENTVVYRANIALRVPISEIDASEV